MGFSKQKSWATNRVDTAFALSEANVISTRARVAELADALDLGGAGPGF